MLKEVSLSIFVWLVFMVSGVAVAVLATTIRTNPLALVTLVIISNNI